jgi:hypothetical protein
MTQVLFYFPPVAGRSLFRTPQVHVRTSRGFTQTLKTTSPLLHGQNLQIRRQLPESTTTHAHPENLPRPQPGEQPEQSRGSPAPNVPCHSKKVPHQESPHSLRQQSSISSSPIPPLPYQTTSHITTGFQNRNLSEIETGGSGPTSAGRSLTVQKRRTATRPTAETHPQIES